MRVDFRMVLAAAVLTLTAAAALGQPSILAPSPADWPQFRGGPYKTGTAIQCPQLLDQIPEGGPKVLWSAPEIGHYSDPTVAQGRVIMTESFEVSPPIPWRMVGDRKFDSNVGFEGWPKLGQPPFFEVRKSGQFFDRKISLATAKKLYAVRNRKFADQQAFAAWWKAAGIPEDVDEFVNRLSLDCPRQTEETVICLEEATGKKLWEWRIPGKQWVRMKSPAPV